MCRKKVPPFLGTLPAANMKAPMVSVEPGSSFGWVDWVSKEPMTAASNQFIPTGEIQLTIKIIYSIIGGFGSLANAAVAIVIGSSPSMRKKLCNLFILNQSLVDFTSSCLLTAFTFTSNQLNVSGIAGYIKCSFWLNAWPIWGMIMTSSYCLLALTLERYIGVVHPFWHRKFVTKTRAIAVMVGIWFIGPAFMISYVVTTTAIIDGICYTQLPWDDPTAQRAHGLITLVLEFFVPFLIMLYCYARMIIVVHQSMKIPSNQHAVPIDSNNKDAGNTPRGKAMDQKERAKKNVITTLVTVCVCFLMCWCWNQVFFLSYNLGVNIAPFDSPYYHFSVIMVFTNCCVNPVVYSLRYREFQQAAKKLFVCCPADEEKTLDGSHDTLASSL